MCGEGTSRPDLTVKTEFRPTTPTMVASQGKEPKFAQIYHHDPDDMDRQLENRRKILATEYWVKMLHNPLVQTFFYADEVLFRERERPVTLQL
jgi:hypothetical protein